MNYVDKFDSGLFSGQGALSGAGESFAVDVQPRSHVPGQGGPDTIVVPDAHLLFSGDYKRSGLDLVLSKDNHEFVVRDYFRGDGRATLASPDGANLSGKTVETLAGQVDYAQAGGAIIPAKVIGQVTKLTGSATAVRNGVSISLNMGDQVHKGDVVQSGSDSSLGITFVDGTVFGLSSNARMVLNEMVYDPAGSNNSSLLTLVQGTISFVAGATAKSGDMKVETPTATMGIRGTAVLVEIDFDIPQPGLAPPVSFRILVEPNGTTGEYVLLDKLTLQPIATVNQPGTKTVVNGQGVVTFFQSADIPANAQRLINEIFTLKFTDANPKFIGIPPLDTITPQTFLAKLPDGTPIDQLPIIRIALVFEAPAAPPPSGGNNRFHLNIPPDLVASSNHFTERFLTTGNTALDTVSGTVHFDDINPEDRPTVTAQYNSFVYRDAQQDVIITSSLTLEQLAAIQAVQVPLSVVQDSGNTNIGDATWTYSVRDHAFDFLAAGETLTLIYMARVDTNYSEYNTVVFTPFKITITGTNDLPTVAGGGSTVIELPGTNNSVTRHAGGVITFADVDLTDRPTVTASLPTAIYKAADGVTLLSLTTDQLNEIGVALGLAPSLTNTNNGSVAWSYDVEDSSFDFLAVGETIILSYTVTVDDGHGGVVSVPLTVTVGVNGTNDAASIDVIAQQSLSEQTNTSALTATIPVTFTDVDLTDVGHIAQVTHAVAGGVTTGLGLNEAALKALITPGAVTKNSGSSAGSVNLAFSAASTAFDYLGVGDTLTLTYTVAINDLDGGISSRTFDVTIAGTDDAPVIHAIAQQNLSEQTDTNPLTATIAVTFTDVDLTDVGHTAQVTQAVATGATTGLGLNEAALKALITPGALTKTPGSSAGSLNLGFAAASTAFDYLGVGDTLTLTYTVAINDLDGGITSRTFVVTIAGTNDAPVIASDGGGATAPISVPENTTAVTTVQATDVDSAALTYSIVAGPGSPDAALFTINPTTGVLSFVTAPDFESHASAAGTNLYTIQVTASDGAGGVDTQTIDVTVTDVPLLAANDTATTDEDAAVTLSSLTANDSAEAPLVTSVANATHGTVSLNGGNPIFQPAANFSGQATFTYWITDAGNPPVPGTFSSATVTVDVKPIADAPVLTTNATPRAIGGEFRINTTTANDQSYSAIGALSDGGFVVAWVSDGQDGFGTGIYAQRYGNSGAAVGSEFRVNTAIVDNQSGPFVTGLKDGGFVVTWTSGGNLGATIHGQRYDSSGLQAGSEFALAGYGENASIAALANGGFVITYVSTDTDLSGMWAVLYDANGTAGSPFLVNTTWTNQQQGDSVAATADGGFIAGWHSFEQDAAGSWGTYFQRFDASGTKLGGEVRANSTVAGDQYGGELAILTDGSFVVSWGDSNSIVLQHFSAAGTSIGAEVVIPNASTATVQALPDGGYFVTYLGADAAGSLGLFGQRVTATGDLSGVGFLINESIAGNQNFLPDRSNPTAVLADGTIASTWFGAPGIAGSEIYGRLFTPPGIGAEDRPITLPNISAAVTDTDGSETLVLALSGFPAGATFSVGALDVPTGQWLISNAGDIAALATTPLTMTPPSNYNGNFTLHVGAVVTDTATLTTGVATDVVTTTHDVTVTVAHLAPVISTTDVQMTSGTGGQVTFSGISVTDADASFTETFTITTATAAPGSGTTGFGPGTLAGINAALNAGITYDPGNAPQPLTDIVALTVADASGDSDTVNLIFNFANASGPITLSSTSARDVLFGTAYQDEFVFTTDSNRDTIIDFTPGVDHIDLSALSSIVDADSIASFLANHVTPLGINDTLITLDGNDTITLRNVSSLGLSDFIVHPADYLLVA